MGALEQMIMDDGGCRRGGVFLEQTALNPAVGFRSLGTGSYKDPFSRRYGNALLPPDIAAEVQAEHHREERHRVGVLRYAPEAAVVPEVGGVGLRTSTGHLLKNQSFFCQRSRINRWDQASHAGPNTWKSFHGPKLRAGADAMQRLDQFDEEQVQLEAKKNFVNTTRVQTLDRFYGQKLERSQQASASSWAPHRRARRQTHSSHETFDSSLDELPEAGLRKVLPDKVLQRDQEAVERIVGRVQQEETWKTVWAEMEKERREDLRADLQARQAHTDRLMLLSGQPIVRHRSIAARGLSTSSSCPPRSASLAQSRPHRPPVDITAMTDFRGLIHTAHCEHVLEQLQPGRGYHASVEFRATATKNAQPTGSTTAPQLLEPPPLRPTQASEADADVDLSISRPSIPVAESRLDKVTGSRSAPDLLARHAKRQFLKTTAPPPPDQNRALHREAYSPASTLASTWASSVHGIVQAKDDMAAAAPSSIYAVIAEASPNASTRAPKRRAQNPRNRQQAEQRNGSKSGEQGDDAAAVRALDAWEATAPVVPGICNFTDAPRRASVVMPAALRGRDCRSRSSSSSSSSSQQPQK
mmetsp:Transcript_132569/g.264563  ORF Transcript_132569/g.264563 Transcript_132569/m.264563 type:complete len:584 (-) Transcript_132569:140-1891(-)